MFGSPMPRFVESGVASALIWRIREISIPSIRRATFIAQTILTPLGGSDMKRLLLLVSITLILGCNKAAQQTSTTTAASTTTQSAPVPAPVPAHVATTGAAP